ncbi:MAG TPA: hypothetical protein VGX25_10475 [Actinophytocola sp.]|uniref:hypothetical protein n=1 Tax=Actinophytocola sp. TaxID=1872138 RepID=UPI002DDC924D|nr:hypothetical protein [Actinophytocola sp.]HEV2779810.1 hypothetical protein [Actinophytocola sp.]
MTLSTAIASDGPLRQGGRPPAKGEVIPAQAQEPPPEIADPTPLDPASQKVASRLTSAFRDSQLIPDGLTLDRGNELYYHEPFEFFVSDGRFVALANLRDRLGVTYFYVEVYWSTDRSRHGECPPSMDTAWCESTVLDDGTRVTRLRSWIEDIGAVSESVAVVRPDGVQAFVHHTNSDRETTRKDLPLDVSHLVGFANLGARSLI